MPDGHHPRKTIMVYVDVDVGIADLVLYLNTIPGVRTHASCQGTIGEGGPNPYRPQVMVTWDSPETFKRLKREFDVSNPDPEAVEPWAWCYVHPRPRPDMEGK